MPKKRKNGGKSRHNRGRVGFVRCDVSGRAVPKDKAIKRFIVRNLVDASGTKDIQEKAYYNRMLIPKMYYKAYYCVSAAIHQRIVRPRNRKERKNREAPPEVLRRWAQQAKRQRDQEKKKMEGRRLFGQQGGGGFGGGFYDQNRDYQQRTRAGARGERTAQRAQDRKEMQRSSTQNYGGRQADPRTNFRGGMRGGGGREGVRAGAGRSGSGRGGGTRGAGGR